MLAGLLAEPVDANGDPQPYGTHNSALTVTCKSSELRDLIFANGEIDAILQGWLDATTYGGMVTLRFAALTLSGQDGSPVLQNSEDFKASIRAVANKVRRAVAMVANSEEGNKFSDRWGGTPSIDEENMHIMLHPSNAVYALEESEVAYVIKAFTTILEKSGAYRGAFADPHPYFEGDKKIVYVGTTKTGVGNIYNCL